jgi:hypothetical protein
VSLKSFSFLVFSGCVGVEGIVIYNNTYTITYKYKYHSNFNNSNSKGKKLNYKSLDMYSNANHGERNSKLNDSSPFLILSKKKYMI